MASHTTFRHPDGRTESVKDGWSWPGFFFTWMWAFVKGLPGEAFGLLGFILLLFIVESATATGVVSFFGGMGLAIFVGVNGNEWVRKKLRKQGFEPADLSGHTRPAAAEESAVQGPFCSECGHPNGPDSRFCSECGAEVQRQGG